ncbi:hypothetical protein JOC26_000371 [Sporohalobacter salinus]|nr:hypothetical protein [Sporohalobacter salinus]
MPDFDHDFCGCSCYVELILVVFLISCLCSGGVFGFFDAD